MRTVTLSAGAGLLATLALTACVESATQPAALDPGTAPPLAALDAGVVLSATGGGHIFVTNPPLAVGDAGFSFTAQQRADGSATGQFRMVRLRDGFVVDFHGEVTCMSVDPVLHRAWIGGVVTSNNSNDPNHSGEIHQPGRDVWFRVVDNDQDDSGAPDRSSVYGFEGAAGIITSAQYCAAQLWTAGDINAFEVTEGNIQVRVRE